MYKIIECFSWLRVHFMKGVYHVLESKESGVEGVKLDMETHLQNGRKGRSDNSITINLH